MEDQFLAHYEPLLGQMTWRLSSMIETETPTSEKASVDRFGAWLATWAAEQGADVKIHHHSVVGDFVECRFNPLVEEKPILICLHMDTVHPLGSIEKRPTRVEEDVLYGVGAYDMKASFAIVQTVMEELTTLGMMPNRPITLLFTSDEEIGSPYSRPLIESLSQEACLVLVMEFCNYQEAIVTARKGVGIFQVTGLGRESHSGTAPQDGINAIVEVTHHIDDFLTLSNHELGTLVTPAIIRGGTRHNVIPGECDLVLNVRVKYKREAQRVMDALETITEGQSYLQDAELILTGDYMRPPMERDEIMEKTIRQLQTIVTTVYGEDSRGGGSDGSFSAALGIPTLDGLGASGEGAHATHEQVYLPSMPRRAALLSTILCCWERTLIKS